MCKGCDRETKIAQTMELVDEHFRQVWKEQEYIEMMDRLKQDYEFSQLYHNAYCSKCRFRCPAYPWLVNIPIPPDADDECLQMLYALENEEGKKVGHKTRARHK